MKTLFLFIAISFSVATQAQISKVSLQASGLTCSMCSNSINKSLQTIDFVEKVNPNIKTSTFEIYFKSGSNVDFEKLRKKVEDAGFTVSSFVATVNFNKTSIQANEPLKVGNKVFKLINAKNQIISGARQIRLVDKGFVTSKEYKKLNGLVAQKGVYNATI